MKYEMPVLTDEQRSAAIERCLQAIKSLEPITGNAEISALLCFRVALAALTSDAKYVPVHGDKMVLMYDAPPLPSLKSIELPDILSDDFYDYGVNFEYKRYEKALKTSIRAEGYEVKE